MKAVIILFNIQKINKNDLKDAFIIGADLGALKAIENGITPDISIGDFDSVPEEELHFIYEKSKKVIKLNPIKDKTDTEEALDLCKDFDSITILGGIQGKRIEHFYSILLYLKKDKRITILDENSKIFTKEESFSPDMEYKFISIFSLEEESIISISGMKYNLENYILSSTDPLGVSNECISNPRIEIHKGRLLVIESVNDYEKL